MNTSRKNKRITLSAVICFLLTFIITIFAFAMSNTGIAYADSGSIKDTTNIENVTREIFGNKKIGLIESLYNLDESADYIYVDFSDYGYAVFLRDTLELMEYAPTGSLPYSDTRPKYYAGPANYLEKDGERFVNIVNGKSVLLTEIEAITRSNEIRNIFSIEKGRPNRDLAYGDETASVPKSPNVPKNAPTPNTFITADLPGSSQTTYIPNANYFKSAPFRGPNNGTSCSAVAIQLLLSYHNYYSDRRIIDNQFLFGNNNNPADRERNPNFCIDPRSLGVIDTTTNFNETLGSTTAFHDLLADNYELDDSSVSSIDTKTNNYLSDRGGLSYSADSVTNLFGALYLSNNQINDAKAEISAGRPIYLAARTGLGSNDWNHAMVAYGYQNLNHATYTNGEDQFGFIVDYGWGAGSVNRWINSGWTYSYTKIQINHTHNYSVPVGGEFNEHRCSVCGHRTNTPFADGQLVQTPDGSIFLMVGGSPLAISFNFLTNVLGSPQTVRISYATFNCLPQYPADGTYVFDGASIFEFVGGAPLPISNVYWVDIIGIQPCIRVDGWSLMRYSGVGCVRRYPADGTYVYDGGSVYEFVGGAPLGISYVYWVNLMGSHSCVRVDNWSLTRYSGIGSVNQHPADNTYVHTLYGDTYYFITQHAYLDNTWTGHTTLVDTYSLQPYL